MIRIVRFEASNFIKECEEKSCNWAEKEYNNLDQQVAYSEGVDDFTEYLSEFFEIPKKRKKRLEVSFCNFDVLSHTSSKLACGYAKKYKFATEQLAYRNGAARVIAELYRAIVPNNIRQNKMPMDNFCSTVCFVYS